MRLRRLNLRPAGSGKLAITELPELNARKYIVSGRVQGVWFRDSTRRQAESLQITGYAKNLNDGTVEVFACGQPQSLDALAEWLAKGPPLASVERVLEIATEFKELHDFSVA